MRWLLQFINTIILAGSLVGCVSSHRNDGKALDATAVTTGNPPQTLQIGDKVHVAVFGEDAITGTYEVDAAGMMSLPLAGTLRAAGLTPAGLETATADRLRTRFLRNPRVTVDAVAVRPFYVLGEVEKPGEYPFRTGLDVWRAMALAGGQTYRASTSTVSIQHTGETQWRDYDLAAAPAVQPGDAIRVPQRWL